MESRNMLEQLYQQVTKEVTERLIDDYEANLNMLIFDMSQRIVDEQQRIARDIEEAHQLRNYELVGQLKREFDALDRVRCKVTNAKHTRWEWHNDTY
jgi:hypothetical protein